MIYTIFLAKTKALISCTFNTNRLGRSCNLHHIKPHFYNVKLMFKRGRNYFSFVLKKLLVGTPKNKTTTFHLKISFLSLKNHSILQRRAHVIVLD